MIPLGLLRGQTETQREEGPIRQGWVCPLCAGTCLNLRKLSQILLCLEVHRAAAAGLSVGTRAPGFKAGCSLWGFGSTDLRFLAQRQGENLPYHPISHFRVGREGSR